MKYITTAVCFFATVAFARQKTDSLYQPANVLAQMQKVANWQLTDWQTNGMNNPKTNWTYATAYTGLIELSKIDKSDKWLKFLVGIGNDENWNTGNNRFHADDYCIGQTYSNLFIVYKKKKMIAPFIALADSIIAKPHAESLDWKNRISDREWAWCDALFMGPPALSYLSTATKDEKYLNTASQLWWKTTAFLYDTAEHLFFRDASFFSKKENNGQKVFWSRGNGWVMAGLVRVLENMPDGHPDRPRFIKLYQEMAARIAGLQQPDGTWHASLLDPGSYPIKETSGTGFYTYAFLWGINHGVLDKKKYWPEASKGWQALVSSVHENGMLGYVQAVGAAPGKVDFNSTETYGTGAFLLAGAELYRMFNKKK